MSSLIQLSRSSKALAIRCCLFSRVKILFVRFVARFTTLSVASSYYCVMSVVSFVTMVVMKCLREDTTVLFAREARSTAIVVVVGGRME